MQYEAHLSLNGQSMSSTAHDASEEVDLLELPESEDGQEGNVTLTNEELGGRAHSHNAVDQHRLPYKNLRSSKSLNPSSTSYNSEPRPYTRNGEVLPERLEVPTNSHAFGQHKRTTDRRIAGMEHLIQRTKGHNHRLYEQNQDFLKEIAQLKDQVKVLTNTNNHLGQMLVPISERQVYDHDVASKFANLRSDIDGHVRRTWRTVLKDGVDLRLLTEGQENLFTTFTPISYELLCSAAFFHINDIILSSNAYCLDDPFMELEDHISQVEIGLGSERGSRHCLQEERTREPGRRPPHYGSSSAAQGKSTADRLRALEWRNATFKWTEKFRGNGQRLSSKAQNNIWAFLSPLQVKDTTGTAAQNARKRLKDICDNAVELHLIMRELKDDFRVDLMNRALGKPFSQWDERAEIITSIPAPSNVQLGTIAYVVTGALVKSPKEDMERDLVLEKAEVAVYE